MASCVSYIVAWIRLLRLPNILTVPGDVIVGILLTDMTMRLGVSLHRLCLAVATSVCIYLFGIVVNDLIDLEVDRIERPKRPLPSGKISLCSASGVGMLLAGLALVCACLLGELPFVTSALLLLMTIAYNLFKSVRGVGVFLMGACRAINILLGLSVVCGSWDVLTQSSANFVAPVLMAVVSGAYVVAFSLLAKYEALAVPPMNYRRFLPLLVLVIGGIVMTSLMLPAIPIYHLRVIAAATAVWTIIHGWLLATMQYRREPLPNIIGGHIRNLMRLQAFGCFLSGSHGILCGLLLLAGSVLLSRISKYYYAS